MIRTLQGDVVHVVTGFKFNAHTLHWHGIEPSPLNDGVGHTSFEGTSRFVYQFATHQAGTYTYHCHKNTTLHFEMGMYGPLLVDPPNPDPADPLQPPYPTGGPGLAAANLDGIAGFRYDPLHHVARYDAEALWVPDEFDSRWHELGHDAFMQVCNRNSPAAAGTFTSDGVLHDLRPDVFALSGVVSVPTTPPGVYPEVGAPIRDPRVALTARRGDTLLIRLINAGYSIGDYGFEGGPAGGLEVVIIAKDGRPLGVAPMDRYSKPLRLPMGTRLRLSTARRVDILVKAVKVGEYPFTLRFYDWLHGPESPTPRLYHIATTVVTVGG